MARSPVRSFLFLLASCSHSSVARSPVRSVLAPSTKKAVSATLFKSIHPEPCQLAPAAGRRETPRTVLTTETAEELRLDGARMLGRREPIWLCLRSRSTRSAPCTRLIGARPIAPFSLRCGMQDGGNGWIDILINAIGPPETGFRSLAPRGLRDSSRGLCRTYSHPQGFMNIS